MRCHPRYWILLLSCVLLAEGLVAQWDPQQWMIRSYSVKDGLSQSSAVSIVQDSVGFIWIGTEDGVNRYDGREFKVYRDVWLDSIHQPTLGAARLGYTSTHRIVGGTDKLGVLVFDPDLDRFNALPIHPRYSEDKDANTVRCFTECGRDSLLIGTGSGAFILDLATQRFTPLQTPPSLGTLPCTVLAVGQAYGEYLLSYQVHGSFAEGGMFRLSTDLRKFRSVQVLDSNGQDLSGFPPVKLMVHGDELWLAYWDRLLVRTGPAGPFQDLHVQGIAQVHLMLRHNDRILIGCTTGLLQLEVHNDRSTRIELTQDTASSGAWNVSDILIDKEGSIWAGTYGALYQIDPLSAKFQHYGRDGNHALPLGDHKVRSIFKDPSDRIWVGTDMGVDLMASDRRSLVHLIGPGTPIQGSQCRAIASDPQGRIFLRTNNGIYRFSNDLVLESHMTSTNVGLSSTSGRYLWCDPDGAMFTGTGLDLLLPGSDRVIQSGDMFPEESALRGTDPFCFFRSRDGTYWLGTTNRGAFAFSLNGDHHVRDLRHFQHNETDPRSLSHDFVTSFREDNAGHLWLATYGGGLNRLDRKTGTFAHITSANGLPNDVVYAVAVDAQNRLWVTSNAGITCFDQGDSSVRSYDPSDRVQSMEFNSNSVFQAPDGEIFFGGINGFNSFYPDSIKLNPFVPPVAFTGLTIGHTPMEIGAPGSPLHRSIVYQDTIELTHTQNDLTVKFAALSFISPEKNQFAYMLHGYKDEWVPLGTQNHVSFTNLDPGKYELRVKAANNDGIWNEKYRTLHIHIAPPWYQRSLATAVFIVAGGAFLFGLGWILLSRVRLRDRVRAEHGEAERVTRQAKEREEFYMDQAHLLKNPLQAITQRMERITSGSPVDEETRDVLEHNVNKMTRRVHELLERERESQEPLTLHVRRFPLNSFLAGITRDLPAQGNDRGITFTLEQAPGDPVVEWDADKVFMAVDNLLGNALKFTADGGRITLSAISTTRTDGQNGIRISVSDTGAGIAEEDRLRIFDRHVHVDGAAQTGQPGSGLGLSTVSRMVRLHHGEVSVESVLGRGSTFHLDLPLAVHVKDVQNTVLDASDRTGRDDALPNSANADREPAGNKPIVLVIEDEADISNGIVFDLQPEFDVFQAFNGEEGIALAAKLVPDLIITDVQMPMKDGYEVTRAVKGDLSTSHVPVIMLTAFDAPDQKYHGLEGGADDFIGKPYKKRELLARVRNAIARTEQVRSFYLARLGLTVEQGASAERLPEELFVAKLNRLIEKNIDNAGLRIEDLCDELMLSPSSLNRKVKALTSLSTKQFIIERRMLRAMELLQAGGRLVGEVGMAVSYGDLTHFSDSFKQRFGEPPSHFLKKA